MKIIAICGSPRKGNTSYALEQIGEALKYMDKMLSVYGFYLAPSLELQVRPGTMPEKNKALNVEKS